jgi:hypothetical protein
MQTAYDITQKVDADNRYDGIQREYAQRMMISVNARVKCTLAGA